MNIMKRLIPIFLCAILSMFVAQKANATHAAGAELIYELVPGTTNTYKFIYKFYRSCAPGAASAPTSVVMCINSFCGTATQMTLTNYGPLPSGLPNGSAVGTGCPGFPTQCSGGTLPGFQEWWFTGNYTIPNTCSLWRFSVSICCRNNAIQNLAGPGGQQLYVEAIFDNTVSQNNNSPFFSNPPIPYCCINQAFSYNNGTIDANGDSLHYESIQPRSGGTCATTPTNCNYVAVLPPVGPYTPLNPFPTGGTFFVDPLIGSVNFTAAATGLYVITVRANEYRNGVFIGSVMRDLQIVVENCSTPSPTYGIDSLTIIGGQLVGGVVQGCATDTLNFCFDITSSSSAAILVAVDNSAISTPGATVTYTGMLTDSIRACLTWPTTLLDTGLHVLSVTVKDSLCTPPGILVSNTFSIPIYINPITVASPDTSICLGDSIQLFVGGGNSFHWTVLPGGDDTTSLSCTYCDSPMVSPSVTTSYVVTSDLVSVCSRSSDTVTIVVATGPTLTITQDTTTCVNATLQLNVIASPTGQPYNYTWSPSTYLSDPSISNPVMQNPQNPTSYTVTVVPQGVLACSSTATVNVDVLRGYDITNNDTLICDGSAVVVNSTGGNPKYTYTWNPATSVSNPSILNPVITPNGPGVYNYTFTATKTGCPDSSQTLQITVNPIPVVNAGPDRELCIGDTIHLGATVTPANPNYTYSWTPVSDLDDASIPDPIFDGVITTMLQVVVSDPIGCSDTDLVLMTVNQSDFLDVDGDRSICPGDTATLTASGAIQYLWTPSMYVTDSLAAITQVFPISTTQFKVYGYNTKGCLDSATANVVVYPGATLDAGENQTIYPGESAQLSADGNCSFFSWFPPTGLSSTVIKNPIAQPSVTTRYFVTARTEVGCTAIDSVDVIVSPESLIDVPNAFSPGAGTSINDEFRIIVKGQVKLNSFRIFNRWGQEIFSTTDIMKGWNGQFNGKPQPLGSYVYVIDAVTGSGVRFYKQGNITLIR
jgi:gliding motility-associated-like protein